MKHAILLSVAMLCAGCGCTSDKCIAITTSNVMHDAVLTSAEALRLSCTEPYKEALALPEAKRLEVYAKLDPVCLPAGKAYSAFAKAQARLEVVLTAWLAGGAGALIGEALKQARDAASELAPLIGRVLQ